MTSQYENYLRGALSKYKYPDQAKREVLNVVQQFADLRPVLNTHVFNDGTSKEMLCLDGTVPVMYKGRTYNIPVCLWLLDTHPYNPPMIYVKPTANMQIKPGRHVDMSGRIYLPYLHEWKHPQSDLSGVIQVLVCVFGDEPPVFAKSQSQPAMAAQPPYPPHVALPPAAATGGYAPYPTSGSAMPMPNYPAPATAGAYRPPGSNATTGYQPYPPAYTGAGQAAQPSQIAPNQPPFQGYPQGFAPYPQTTQTYPQQTATAAGSNATITDEMYRASLLSAVEDKIRRRLREVFDQAQAEMNALKKTQEDLQKGRQKLDDMLQRLEREQNVVEENIRQLRQKDDDIRDALTKMDSSEEVNIDEVIQPSAPLYKQLLNAFAEEQATEDAVYYMGEALRKGVVELDVFLKQVRELSRKQFMCRMLIRKCRQTAGLPEMSA